jgi:hypothetical protein
MIRLQAVYIITNEGFLIYGQTFGISEKDQDMVASLMTALRSFGEEIIERDIDKIAFEGGADMILVKGNRIQAIVMVLFDQENKELEELQMKGQLTEFINEIEEIYMEELEDPIFKRGSFSRVGTLISTRFFRDKMSRIHGNQFANINEYIKYPTTLLFEITPHSEKLYSFYRKYPQFVALLKEISWEECDKLILSMQQKNSMVSFKECLDHFGPNAGKHIFEIMKFLTKKGILDAYHFERITTVT